MESFDLILKRGNDLCKFLNKGVSQYHIVSNIKESLLKNGFQNFNYKNRWDIPNRLKGFVQFGNSSIFAFSLNKGTIDEGIKFIMAHLDSPCLKIKSGGHSLNVSDNLYLNVEVYGGAILSTWLDRGLSIAGKVFVKSKDYSSTFKIEEVLLDFKDEVAFIPNCPIHLNREINSGFALNKQKHMMPIVLTSDVNNINSFEQLISEYLNIREDDIIDFDLCLYDTQRAKIIGGNNEFIQSKRIDDLAMAEISIYSLLNSDSDSNKFVCLFDGEEVGSSVIEGANSSTFTNILMRIYKAMGIDSEDMFSSLDNSFIISADMAHGYNNNYSDRFDDLNRCILNKGVVIKNSYNKNYITTGESSAYFKSLCDRADVPYQIYFNRSDMYSGSTIGPIITRYVSIRGIDVGNPMFAMHSCRETAGILDHYYMTKVFREYFK